jgi:hypothetical protein
MIAFEELPPEMREYRRERGDVEPRSVVIIRVGVVEGKWRG